MFDNNLDWKGYEEITRYIYHTLGNRNGIKILGHGLDYKIKGKSKVEHQIDVLTKHTDGNRSFFTAIECKYWKKKVTKDTVMKLASIIDDTNIEKGIIVSKEGFTSDASTYAQHKNIELVQLKEAGKEYRNGKHSLDIGVLHIGLNIIRTRPEITCIDFGGHKITDEREILSMHYGKILLSNGSQESFGKYMSAFQNKLHQQKPLETYSKSYEVNAKLIGYRKEDVQFDKIVFTGVLVETDLSTTKSFNIVDQVWMLMNEIFEKKVFVVSKGGIIFQDA